MNDYDTIKEGPVTIEFSESSGKIKFKITVDFAKTDYTSHKAATVFRAMVGCLRSSLDVELLKCR